MAQKDATQIIGMMEKWFAGLPGLPKSWREVIVKIVPWIALVFGILGILTSLPALGIVTAVTPFATAYGYYSGLGIVMVLISLVSSILLLAAFPGTNKHKLSGWNFLFYSELVSLLASVIGISVGGVIFNIIGFYILFQIKSYYK